MFAKTKTVLGIDIGTHSVKVVQLSKFGDGAKVDKAALFSLNPDVPDEQRIEGVIRVMRTVASTFAAKKAVVAAALPGEDTFIRYLRFPKMPADELRSSIELEADQNLPYDLSELSMDSVVLEEMSERGETIMKVLLVAAKNDIIGQTLEMFRTVGITPGMLGVTTLAIADSFEANGGFTPEETIALVNVGASSTNIHFCRDGVSNFTRDISRAGRDLTGAIQKLMKVDYAEAERMKIEYGRSQFALPSGGGMEPPSIDLESEGAEVVSLDEPADDSYEDATTEPMSPIGDDTSRIVNATRPALSRLIGEIRRSIDYYEKQLYEKNVDRLVLSGGSAVFPGLDQALADATGVPVEIVNPVQTFIVEESSPEVQDLMQNKAQFNVAVGLAAREFSET